MQFLFIGSKHKCYMNASLIAHPHSSISFLVTDSPAPDTLTSYIDLLTSHKVTLLFRLSLSETTYDPTLLNNAHITLNSTCAFTDGALPTVQQLEIFYSLVTALPAGSCVGLHCVSGIGRAPLLATIGILYCNPTLQPEDVVAFVRSKRRGALNAIQLQFILKKGYQLKKATTMSKIKSIFKKTSES